MRLIDADALIADCQMAQKQADRDGREYANAFYSGGGEISTEWWCVEDMIENAPTIEPERKRGKWETTRPDAPMFGFYYCSLCGRKRTSPQDHFCPNCGAEMKGEDND